MRLFLRLSSLPSIARFLNFNCVSNFIFMDWLPFFNNFRDLNNLYFLILIFLSLLLCQYRQFIREIFQFDRCFHFFLICLYLRRKSLGGLFVLLINSYWLIVSLFKLISLTFLTNHCHVKAVIANVGWLLDN
jgi:hypothetical protein